MGPFRRRAVSSTSPCCPCPPTRVSSGQRRGLTTLVESTGSRMTTPAPYWSYRVGPAEVRPNWVVERVQRLENGRVVVSVDDRDRLTGAVERQIADAVGRSNLGRGVGDAAGERSKLSPSAMAAPLSDIVSTMSEMEWSCCRRALPLSTSKGRRRADHAADTLHGGAAEGQGLGVVAALEDEYAGVSTGGQRGQIDRSTAAQRADGLNEPPSVVPLYAVPKLNTVTFVPLTAAAPETLRPPPLEDDRSSRADRDGHVAGDGQAASLDSSQVPA